MQQRRNETHAFHLHTNHFQLMSVNGQPYDGHGLQDTESLPFKGQFVIRIRFTVLASAHGRDQRACRLAWGGVVSNSAGTATGVQVTWTRLHAVLM